MIRFWPWLVLFLPIIIFFYPVWGKGLNPIPADTLTGLYHPYRDTVADQYPNGTPYKNFLITDAVRQQYVYRQFSIEQLKQGQLPWWNPYNFAGTPHLAGFQAATFYPLNVLFWLFDFTQAWNFLVMLQPILGAAFMFIYLRSLKLAKFAAVFGSLTWIFSGFFVVWLEWNTAVHVALWSPLVLFLIDRLIGMSRNSITPITRTITNHLVLTVTLAFALVSQFYGGYPQPWLYLSLLQVSYVIWRLLQKWLDSDFHLKPLLGSILALTGGYIIFVSLAAPQLKATLDFSELSNRATDQGEVLDKPDWFIPYPQLLQVIIPDFFGNPATLNYWGVFNYTEFVSFVGVIPFTFVLMAWLRRQRQPEIWFFSCFLILALVLAVRNPISELQFRFDLPFISGSQPSRWLVIINLTLAVLAGLGLDAWIKRATRPRWALSIVGLILVGVWLVLMLPPLRPWSLLTENLAIARRNSILPLAEFLGAAGVIGFVSWAYSRSNQVYLLGSFLIILASTAIGLRFAQKFTPFTDPAFLYPETKILTYLQDKAGLYRYQTTDRRLMAPNTNMAYKLYTIEGYDPLYLASYGQLITAAESSTWPEATKNFNRIVTTETFDSPIINLLGVKYLLSLTDIDNPRYELLMVEGKTRLYENTQVFPRAYLIDSLDSFPPKTYQDADITSYQPNQVIIEAQTSEPTYLILSDAWYPDWRVEVDGQLQTLINWYGLRAVLLNPGEHEIIYQYRHPNL